MIYYTADPHFGYAPMLPGRPFETVEEMDEALVEGWNRAVGPEDTVYLIGDVGFNDGHVPCRILARLNGRKHLIRGNHDTGFVDAPLLYRYFESVTDFLEIDDGPHHILLSHYPMLYGKPVGYMIHGHLHRSPQFHEILGSMPRVLNAGVDVNGFVPVTLEQLIENNRKFYSQTPEPAPRHRSGKGLLPGKADFRPVPVKPQPHPKHLFLTGCKRIGKSTVLQRLLEGRDMELGGFLTRRVPGPAGASVYMLRPGRPAEYTPENCLFLRTPDWKLVDYGKFNSLGVQILRQSRGSDLILMDELGPGESGASAFCRAVRECLDGEKPVYGVLQQAQSQFLDEIKTRSDVCVITVTEDNRENLPRILLEQGW